VAGRGAVFEAEFERRAEIIDEASRGTRPRADARAELVQIAASANQRARAVLGDDRYATYLERRQASGLPDGSPEPDFITKID
jgi:hypothetical protein